MGSGWIPVGIAATISAMLLFVANPASPASMVLALLATLPLFLVGLSLGWFHGAAAAGAAFLAILMAIGLLPAAYYLVVNALPVTLLLLTLERDPRDPGRAVVTLTGLAAAPMIVAALFLVGTDGGLSGVIRSWVGELQDMLPMPPEAVPEAQWQAMLDRMAQLLPGLGAVFWVVLITVNGLLAQAVLRRFGKARLPSPDIATLYLPRWMPGVLAAAAALSFLPGEIGYLGGNLVPLAALPFLFSGLGVLHAWLRRMQGGVFWLAMFYMLLLIVGWPAVIAVVLGLIDVLVDFRRRLGQGGPPPDPEDE